MNNLKWIESAGGPLALIDKRSISYWSGVLNRNEFLQGKMKEAIDTIDANETDYGKACLISDLLGLVDVGNNNALILGDEPLTTTGFVSVDNKDVLVRLYYGSDIGLIEELLQSLNIETIPCWKEPIEFEVSSNIQYLFDAGQCGWNLNEENMNALKLNIREGRYIIWTSIYEPNNETKLIIHKFESIG